MSHNKVLKGKKVAILIANGFNEKTLTAIQRFLMNEGALLKIVSSEAGLVSGWNESSWGHHYAVDKNIEAALGSDYDVLVVPGGKRSIEKLNLTQHTKRFVGSFVAASKPIVAFDNALEVLAKTENIAGRTVSGPEAIKEDIMRAGVLWSDDAVCIDENIMTGVCDSDEDRMTIVNAMTSFFSDKVGAEEDEKLAA